MGRPVVHFEILGKEHEKLRDFYRGAFDWRIDAVPGPAPYGFVRKEAKGIGGGIGPSQDGRSMVTVYVDVPDTDAALRKIQQLGGKVVMPTTTIPGIVTFALFADPVGNIVGLSASAVPSAAGAGAPRASRSSRRRSAAPTKRRSPTARRRRGSPRARR